MHIQYKTANGRMQFTIEASNTPQAFEEIAEIQEVFEEKYCGRCLSEHIRFDVREFNGDKYFKYVCLQCRGQLDIGKRKDGGLFIKRKDKEGRTCPMGGWYIWDDQLQKENRGLTDQEKTFR